MLVDQEQFRATWRLDPGINDRRFELALASADAQVKRYVGEDAYADAGAEEPENPERALALQLAVLNLAMATALPFLSTHHLPNGIATSIGAAGGNSVTYLGPGEIAEIAARLRAEALDAIAPWVEAVAGGSTKVGLIDPFKIAERADVGRLPIL